MLQLPFFSVPFSVSKDFVKLLTIKTNGKTSALFIKFQCDLCDAGYVCFTRRHLHQRVEEHKNSSSSIGKHFRHKHSLAPKDLTKNFSVLMKCTNKFDCLVY